jgi:hypothetical protein
MTAPMSASVLAARIDRLGPVWAEGRRLDGHMNAAGNRAMGTTEQVRESAMLTRTNNGPGAATNSPGPGPHPLEMTT